MKRSIGPFQFLGFALTALGGTLLHYAYDWLGGAIWIAPFSGVNESTFEHMKLFFWPAFVYAIIQWFFFRERRDFFCIKARGILLGLLLIPILFYTYNGAVAKSPDFLNISIFFISAAVAFVYETRLFYSERSVCRHPKLALSLLCSLGALFVLFTFRTPEIGLFRDPITGLYGI